MDEQRQVHQASERQWPTVCEEKGHVEDDIDNEFIDGAENDVSVRLHNPQFTPRARPQEAWITLVLLAPR